MAITLKSNNVATSGYVANGNSADLSGCETLVAAVAAKSIYIERIAVSFGAEITVTIGEGESSDGVETVLIGPLYGAENTTVELVFNRPVKLTAATALTADASGSGNVTVVVQGYIE